MLAVLVGALLGFSLVDSARASEGRAVLGRDRALIQPPSGAHIETYENLGYHLSWHGDLLLVEVDTTPIRTSSSFTLSDRPAPSGNGLARLAWTLTSRDTDRFLAVSHILGWVADNVRYDLNRSQPQDPVSVLRRRSGYCTGVASLTVAMLEAVGIEAREVAGFVTTEGGNGGYHRWIEVFYPDRGWVFSDPLTFHHFVPATYLRLASEELDPAAPQIGRVVARSQTLGPIDVYPYAPEGVLARRNGSRQRAAALRLAVDRETPGTVTLEGSGRAYSTALRDGQASFVDLRDGRHRLTIELQDGLRLERTLEIEADAVRRVEIGPGASEGWYRLAEPGSADDPTPRTLSGLGRNR